ncbi:hypothetical protein EPUS_07791 [Endocarpon pusillum Z07020]|uniref:Uncharacterized protein n=1 Tax=Endocarpon pusillum (strain Z07020 / HMAS-L-300199) TaxID=1263415 RepID=U1GC17_ENDPU|nr:uncharacterized protein EPUS_07791 [Endocarpon pusillum Z07020]ERF75102.1 hypothetical protein EPUS_07791 [Endocarpon pusillum Z07020]
MTAQSIKKGVCDALANVEVSGSFACFHVLDSFPNPALFIRGLGTIGLPLSVRDAQAIASSSVTQQSPFGKGSQTLVDTSVRKSWQIDPAYFHLRNPRLGHHVGRVVETVAKELNVACGPRHVRAELYKLLLYEEGAFFLPHQDGEKVKGMFGTLMICLPSQHSGGEIHLSHEGKRQIISTSETSDFEYSYAAWYSDVTHEVKPVTGGYRLVLIYNLVQTSSGPTATASASTDSKSKLKSVLSQWSAVCNQENPDIPRMLAYKLSYKYSKSSLSFEALKGSDHVKFRYLLDACNDQNFLVYLAHIEKEVTGGCDESEYWDRCGGGGYYGYDEDSADEDTEEEDQSYRTKASIKDKKDLGGCHEIIDLVDSSIQLTRVIDRNRKEIAKTVDFDVEDIAQGDIFERAPDGEDFTGYTGNEGVSTTHFYHDTVVLLLPQTCRVDLMYKAAKEDPDRILSWMKRLREDHGTTSDASKRLELERLCHLVLQQERKTSSERFSCLSTYIESTELLEGVASAALKLDNVPLLEEALGLQRGEPSVEMFGIIGGAIPRLGFETLKPALETAFRRIKHIDSKRSALLHLAGEPSSASGKTSDMEASAVKGWVRAQMESIFLSCSSVTPKDGTALAEVADEFGAKMLEQRIVPFVEAKSDHTSFAMAFLIRLFELRGRQVPVSTVAETYRRVIEKVITQFDWGASEERLPIFYPVSGDVIMQTLQQCEVLSLSNAICNLFHQIQHSALNARTDVFGSLLLPYIELLLTHLRKGGSCFMLSNDCREHVHLILQAYIIRYIGPEPRRPTDWSRPTRTVRCSCRDCLDLKAFVKDSIRETCEFRIIQARRKHLEKQLPRTGYRCQTITSGSPHALVITKVHEQYVQEHSQWQNRFDFAKKHIRNLDSNPWLKHLLGDKHDEILNLKITDRPLSMLSPQLHNNNKSELGQHFAGNKRKEPEHNGHEAADPTKRTKLNIVDLTAD